MTIEKKEVTIIKCDARFCDCEIQANPNINLSGWRERGIKKGNGEVLVWHYCPEHAPEFT